MDLINCVYISFNAVIFSLITLPSMGEISCNVNGRKISNYNRLNAVSISRRIGLFITKVKSVGTGRTCQGRSSLSLP